MKPLSSSTTTPPSQAAPAIAAFVIGGGVMAVEITASRLLAPYFGASMFVWTSLIVTVLVALSAGYHAGGRWAAQGAGLDRVGLLAAAAAVLLVPGTLAIPALSSAIYAVSAYLPRAAAGPFLGSLAAAAAVFACPVFLLAMSGPILLKAWSSHGDVGAVSGRYFAISTAGSVAGTVAPALVLVPALGARATVFAVAMLLLLLGAALAPRRCAAIAASCALALALAAQAFLWPTQAGVVMERESPYQLIRVTQVAASRYLVFNEGLGIQSVHTPGGQRTGLYFDYAGILPLARPRPAGAKHQGLVIGLAGGTMALRYPSLLADGAAVDLTGVEVDPAVIDTARRYFDLGRAGVRVVNEDGRMFLRATAGRYDSLVVDAYSNQIYIPPHLATREFFALAKSRLAADGVFAMNVSAPSGDSPLLKALGNTAAAVFRHVVDLPVGGSWNHFVLASDAPFALEEMARRVPAGYEDIRRDILASRPVSHDPHAEVFTDDRAPVEFMTDSMIAAHAFGGGRW